MAFSCHCEYRNRPSHLTSAACWSSAVRRRECNWPTRSALRDGMVTLSIGEHVRMPRIVPRPRRVLVAGAGGCARPSATTRCRRHGPASCRRALAAARGFGDPAVAIDLNGLHAGGVFGRRPARAGLATARADVAGDAGQRVRARRPQAGGVCCRVFDDWAEQAAPDGDLDAHPPSRSPSTRRASS